jgi:hypothetical protein
MKKLLTCLFATLIFSCSVDDDTPRTHIEILPVESAILPDEFVQGEVYEITLTYLRPSSCHAFRDIFYEKNLNERTVAIVTTVFDSNNNCEEISTELEKSFNFKPTSTGSYIFKFWQGTDDNGDEQYMTVEVPVI